ncbi:hypothetical protein MOF08_14280, partial [Bacillus licheniformis]|uniref:hypothetical protein n=1 Tax=Bacillus licheniformis TaxID=1402 RepID=UPI00227F8BFC
PFSGDPYITIAKGVKYKDLLINQCVMLQNISRMFKPPRMGRIHTTTSLINTESSFSSKNKKTPIHRNEGVKSHTK